MLSPVFAQVLSLALGLCGDGSLRSCTIAGCVDARQICLDGYWEDCTCYEWAVTCNDDNPCTADASVNNTCTYTPSVGIPCDDGDPCTGQGTCTAQGTCSPGQSIPMSDADPNTYDRCVEGVGGPVNTLVDRSPAPDQGEAYASPAAAPNPLAQSVPGMPLAGAPTVVENTGEVRYSYAFALPSARGRFQPALSITYSSRSTSTEGIAFGWSPPVSYIDSDWARTPRPYWDIALFVAGARERHRLVSGPQSTRIIGGGAWAFEVGGGTARITRTSTTNAWEVVDLHGTTSKFETCFDASTSRRCYLSSVTDVDGNRTEYTYSQQTGAVAVLTQLRYNNFSGGFAAVVDLAYVIRGGSPAAPERVLETVTVSVASPNTGALHPLHKYTLSYATSGVGAKQMLEAITLSAGSGTALKSLPAVRFSYEVAQPKYALTAGIGTIQLPISATGDPRGLFAPNDGTPYEPVYPTAAWMDRTRPVNRVGAAWPEPS